MKAVSLTEIFQFNIMDIQKIKIKKHFYYCLFIALLVESKSGKIKSNKQKKRFLLSWINRAKSLSFFSDEVDDEIIWIKKMIIMDRHVEDIEHMLKNVYESASYLTFKLSKINKHMLKE